MLFLELAVFYPSISYHNYGLKNILVRVASLGCTWEGIVTIGRIVCLTFFSLSFVASFIVWPVDAPNTVPLVFTVKLNPSLLIMAFSAFAACFSAFVRGAKLEGFNALDVASFVPSIRLEVAEEETNPTVPSIIVSVTL